MSAWRIEWFVADSNANLVGRISAAEGSLDWQGDSRIQRVCRNVQFDKSEWGDINPFEDWFVPILIDSSGANYRLGLFTAAAIPQVFLSEGVTENPEPYLVDGGFFLDQPSPYTLSCLVGERYEEAIARFVEQAGIERYVVEPTGEIFAAPIAQSPGASFSQIINSVCELAGLLPPSFDRNGVLRVEKPRSLLDAPDISYTPQQVIASSRVVNDNLLEAANAVVVVGSGANNVEVFGYAEAPPNLPFSIQNRGGKRISKVVKLQGVTSRAQAENIARTIASKAAEEYETVEFSTVPNGLHDCYNIVELNGSKYREISWSIDLSPGGVMNHSVVKGFEE